MRLQIVLLVFTAICLNHSWGLQERRKAYLLRDPYTKDISRLVVITRSASNDGRTMATGCEFIEDSTSIENFLRTSPISIHLHPTAEEMEEILQDCNTFSPLRRRRQSNESEEDYSNELETEEDRLSLSNNTGIAQGVAGFNIIFPGTKWCGAGDIARKFDDLGFHQDTDRCCRAHDLCEDTMAGGETKNNLTNSSPFTALNCKCDDEFYNCLDRVDTITSNTVGNSYFNVLNRRCYALDYPTTKKCKKYRTFLKLTCLEYERDKKAPKVWQWFPAKTYKKIPFPGPLTPKLPF